MNRSSRRELPPKTIPHSFGFKPEIDLNKLGQLVDELEVEAFVENGKLVFDVPLAAENNARNPGP